MTFSIIGEVFLNPNLTGEGKVEAKDPSRYIFFYDCLATHSSFMIFSNVPKCVFCGYLLLEQWIYSCQNCYLVSDFRGFTKRFIHFSNSTFPIITIIINLGNYIWKIWFIHTNAQFKRSTWNMMTESKMSHDYFTRLQFQIIVPTTFDNF